jgi:hypothetical protein
MKTENLFTLAFVFFFVFTMSFFFAPQFALWLLRLLALWQAYWYFSLFLDRFRL